MHDPTNMDMLNDAAAMWKGAARGEKRDILRAIFDSIVVDLDTEKVVRWAPKTQFAALFRAAN